MESYFWFILCVPLQQKFWTYKWTCVWIPIYQINIIDEISSIKNQNVLDQLSLSWAQTCRKTDMLFNSDTCLWNEFPATSQQPIFEHE